MTPADAAVLYLLVSGTGYVLAKIVHDREQQPAVEDEPDESETAG